MAKRFNIKEFAKWHKEKYGPGIFLSDICEYYITVLGRKDFNCEISNERFESIVERVMEINNY